MICPRCGANNDNSEQYCYQCGLKLDSAAQGQPSGGAPVLPPAPLPPAPPAYDPSRYGAQPPVYGNPGGYQPLSPYGTSQYAPVQPTSTAAIISLVAGIISWIALPFVSGIVAVIAGHMARAEIRRSNGAVAGGGMALAGLILGYLNILIVLGSICVVVLLLVVAGNTSH